jgi:hypothetical protein
MGTFAETADVNHQLPFANQGKTKFHFPFVENKLTFLLFWFSICNKHKEL